MKSALISLLLASSASASDIAVNTFGPNDTYQPGGYILYGPDTPTPWLQGFQFTAQASGDITKLIIPLRHTANSNSFLFEVYTDAAGQPGTTLGVIGLAAGFESANLPPIQVPAVSQITLTAGARYWLVGSGLGDAQGSWLQSDHTGLRAYISFGSNWQTAEAPQSAFRIEVEPAAPACYANCDHSTAEPTLNANDFQCFLNTFAAGCP